MTELEEVIKIIGQSEFDALIECGEMPERLYELLFVNYYIDREVMPYNIKKSRDEDPYEWIYDRIIKLVEGGADSDTVAALINSVAEPVFVIVPNEIMEDEDLIKLFRTIESLLLKIEEKTDVTFDLLVEDAGGYGGYQNKFS